MIGKILFLSAAAYASYWYIRRSNRKAQEISRKADLVEILPPENIDSSARLLPAPSASRAAVEPVRALKSPVVRSRAVEPEPGR